MPIAQKSLLSQLDNAILGGASVKGAIRPVNSNLVGSLMCSTYSNVVNTTSGSGVVNIPIVQPANTVIEDIIPICTSAASFDAASLGFLVSSGSHGAEDVVLPVVNAIAVGSSESTPPGQGSSIHGKVVTSMGGGAPLVITPAAGYTATERTLYTQVSGSTGGFDNNTGAFRVIIKYYNL
tara:strand:- start:7 stop:546 length:540 start_codon:yes stop_codon:yes gene_type:complete